MSRAQLSEVILGATWKPPSLGVHQEQRQSSDWASSGSVPLGNANNNMANESQGVVMLTTCDHNVRCGDGSLISIGRLQ